MLIKTAYLLQIAMQRRISALLAVRKPKDLKVAELKNLLGTVGKSKKGKKADLIAR